MDWIKDGQAPPELNTPMRKFELDRATFVATKSFTNAIVEQMGEKWCRDWERDRWLHQIKATIFGRQIDRITYPFDWWEAFKERWFPKWLLHRYPVKYKIWQVAEIFPKLMRPPNQGHVALYEVDYSDASIPFGYRPDGPV